MTAPADDLALAERAAHAAGALLAERFGGPASGVAHKSSATDPVSDADRAAERAIADLLAAERPDDGLLAEEGSGGAGSSGRRWVVDPLDGTTNFLYGLPAWCVSVALEDAAGALVAVVHDPLRAETFSAVRGEGARLAANGGGAPMRVRTGAALERALVATGFAYDARVRERQGAVAAHLLPRVRDLRRGGSAALDLAWLAAGRLDAYYERGVHPWDTAAGALLVREAGGALADLEGEPPGIAAAAPELLADVLKLLSQAGGR